MKAVLVICEGRSDIAFVRRSLIAIAECKEFIGKVRDLPAPFGTIQSTASKGLIATHINRSFSDKPADDQKIAGSERLSPPQFDSAVLNKEENILYLFVNSEGRDQHKGVVRLLEGVDVSMKNLRGFEDLDVKEYATAFLFDANSRGKDNTIKKFNSNYCDHFGCILPSDHAVWIKSDKCPVGVFICCGEDGKGATENYIIQMVSSAFSERYQGACKFIDENKKESDKVSKSEVNILKAIITTVGQFNFPGYSFFPLINDECKGIPDGQFQESDACDELIKFLQNVPW